MDRELIDRWDAEAARFDEAADHGLADPETRAAWTELLTGVLPLSPARVADLGCGTGTLSVLVAELGHQVDGVDFAPEMLRLAAFKARGRADVSFQVGDAADPPLKPGSYDVVLCRHVLWALPDPAAALRRWTTLLAPAGRLVLIEGHWHTGAGLRSETVSELLATVGRTSEVTELIDPTLWGREIADERFIAVSYATG